MISDPEDILEPAVPPDGDGDGDGDEALDDAAQGFSGTSDESADGAGEIDAMAQAAGLANRDDKPFRGIDEVDRRDDHRWELDPASAEDDRAAEDDPVAEPAHLRDGTERAATS